MEQQSSKTTKKLVNPELQKARDDYKAQTGKNAYHTWNVDTIAEKLQDFRVGDISSTPPSPTKAPKDRRVYVHLRVFQGITMGGTTKVRNVIGKDEDTGELLNENQLVKLQHGTLEWKNYLKQLPKSSWFKADVVKVLQGSEEASDKKAEIQSEVDAAYKNELKD